MSSNLLVEHYFIYSKYELVVHLLDSTYLLDMRQQPGQKLSLCIAVGYPPGSAFCKSCSP